MVRQQEQAKWTPAWATAASILVAVAVVLAERAHLLHFAWQALPVVAVFGAAMTAVYGLAHQWELRTHVHRAATWVAAGWCTTWASGTHGWPWWPVLLGGGTAMLLAGLAPKCRTVVPEPVVAGGQPAGVHAATRPAAVLEWETLLRRLTKAPVTVARLEPWAKPQDGIRAHVVLPPEGDITAQEVAAVCPRIAVARRLPPGCSARVLDGDNQGEVVIDVMLRDCLVDTVILEDDYRPASINDAFTIMWTPRGEMLDVCLRSQSMVIGGAPESGKTTLLHRIMLFLARCTDAIIWVADANGGGAATPLVRPWAMGKAGRPLVDWVAADEAEAAVMTAVATAIAKDRKTAPEAVRRRHDRDTTVLPVDRYLPAIVVLNDEGGELRQAVGLLGQLADQGISRLTQIGRAEAVRTIKSVLRGTSDLLDKGMRVCAPQRIALRMEEQDEYEHVLGVNPGKTVLTQKGSGFIRRPGDPRPIHGRTVNVLLSQIERAAVACADLRPDLDERARRVAAKVRGRDVLGGKDVRDFPDIANLPVMRDVEAGLAYENRWVRFASRLAAMRGEEVPEPEEVDDEPAATATAPAVAVPPSGGPIAALLDVAGTVPAPPAMPAPAAVGAPAQSPVRTEVDGAAVEEATDVLLAGLEAPNLTAREHIVMILGDVYPEALTSNQIGAEMERRTGKAGNRTHRQDLLTDMVERGVIVRVEESAAAGRYTVKR